MPSANRSTPDRPDIALTLAETTRQACIQAALTAFEDASTNGLCCEGAWESAVGAMQRLDLRGILRTFELSTNP